MIQFSSAQSDSSRHHVEIGIFYIGSQLDDQEVGNFTDNRNVPFGAEIFGSYRVCERWNIEAGFDFRSRKKGFTYILGNNDATIYPVSYTSWYLDALLCADYHWLGKHRFNFNLLVGAKGTWRHFDSYLDDTISNVRYYFSKHDFSSAISFGFKESVRISDRIKITSEELFNLYLLGGLHGEGGIDLKVGIEYILR